MLSLVIGLLILVSNSFGQCTNASNIYTFTIDDTVFFVKGQNKWYIGITKYEIIKEKKELCRIYKLFCKTRRLLSRNRYSNRKY